MKFTQSDMTLEELEKFRDKDGFIDLDKVELLIDENSRNQMGTPDILKYWIDFSGNKVLLKESKVLDGEQNYSVYSELIVTEIAKQLGLEAAGCDLIKFKGRIGIISNLAFEYGKETLETIHGVIGETNIYSEFEDLSDFAEVEEKIAYTLTKGWNIPKRDVWNLIIERRKQKILQMFVYEADNHLENEAIIIGRNNDGETTVKIAPMFDNEQSFLLNYAIKDLEKYNDENISANIFSRMIRGVYKELRSSKNIKKTVKENEEIIKAIGNMEIQEIKEFLGGNRVFKQYTRGVATRVACLEEADLYPGKSITDRTLAYVIDCDDDEIYDFCDKLQELDMNRVFASVEEKIKASIPRTVKDMVTTVVNYRKIELNNIMEGRNLEESYENAAKFLKSIAEKYMEREDAKADSYAGDEIK